MQRLAATCDTTDDCLNYVKYRSQISTLERINAADYVLFAFDASFGGQKIFTRIPLDELHKVQLLLADNCNAYEWLYETTPIKPYFDCEMEGTLAFRCDVVMYKTSVFIHLFIATKIVRLIDYISDTCLHLHGWKT
jgi:hypothetical protein